MGSRTCRMVISRGDPSDAKRREFEDKLAEQCAAQGVPVLVVPHLYRLTPDSRASAALCALQDPILFFSWLRPRAAYWTLRSLGVKGTRAKSLRQSPGAEDRRPILCLSLADKCCPGRWVEAIQDLLGGAFPGGRAAVERIEEACPDRWYPVLDYDRCTNCQECLEFCLFGVYDADPKGRVRVAQPEACKPGCPACGRVCPNAAVMFPLYEADPVIAGADEGKIKPFTAPVDQLRRDYRDGKLRIEDVIRACGCDAKGKGRASAGSPDRPDAKDNDRGYFDKLIDGLVKE